MATYAQPIAPVTLTWPSQEASMFQRFNAQITGDISDDDHMLDVWTPEDNHRVMLKGGCLTAIVTADLPTTINAGSLMFFDDTKAGGCVYPICTFGPGDRKNTDLIGGTFSFDVVSGQGLTARDKILRIGSNNTIGSGSIEISGVVWGEETIR